MRLSLLIFIHGQYKQLSCRGFVTLCMSKGCFMLSFQKVQGAQQLSSWITTFLDLSITWYHKEHVSETGCFHPQMRLWETPTLLSLLEKANLNQWI
jgi:hypothetical protein